MHWLSLGVGGRALEAERALSRVQVRHQHARLFRDLGSGACVA